MSPLDSPLLLCPQRWKPPTCPPYCLDNTQHHLLSLLILSLSLWDFFLTFLYVLFCSSVTSFMPVLSVSPPTHPHPRCSFIVALVIISHTFYVGAFSMAYSCVSFCFISHRVLPTFFSFFFYSSIGLSSHIHRHMFVLIYSEWAHSNLWSISIPTE